MAHKIYGIPQTINTANYVYFLAYQELFVLRDTEPKTLELDRLVTGKTHPSLIPLICQLSFIEELLNLHRGQGLDLLWRDSLTCPTEDEYIHMVNNSMVSFQPQPPISQLQIQKQVVYSELPLN